MRRCGLCSGREGRLEMALRRRRNRVFSCVGESRRYMPYLYLSHIETRVV